MKARGNRCKKQILRYARLVTAGDRTIIERHGTEGPRARIHIMNMELLSRANNGGVSSATSVLDGVFAAVTTALAKFNRRAMRFA